MKRIPLAEWSFTKESCTERVTLPHCWNRAGEGPEYYRGLCHYECELPPGLNPDKAYYAEFEGAGSTASLEVNGEPAGEHRGGYSLFRFDITGFIKGGSNILRLAVDNSPREDVYPLMADFAFMGGLYRPAWLIETESSRIDLDDCGSEGVYVKQRSLSRDQVEFDVEAGVTTGKPDGNLTCVCTVIDPEGRSVLRSRKRVRESPVAFSFTLEHPRLWRGRRDPALYEVRIGLTREGREVDSRRIFTGFRLPRADPREGFFLNREPLPLRGVSRHQDREGAGWALTAEHMQEDMGLIKELGANAIRLAHYQHSRDFYRMCDREGLVVWAEIPYISRTSREDKKGTNALRQLEELIKQNYNSPSICFWGLQNEITIGNKKNRARKITARLNRLAKELDPVRLTAQAQVGHYPDAGAMNGLTDCLGYNKYYGWYYGEFSDLDRWLDDFARTRPDRALGITEYGAEGRPCFHSDTPAREDYTEEYQALYHEETMKIFRKHPRLWGTFIWNMFDFASPIRDEGGIRGMNSKGLVTYDRKIKKDAFYWYKAHWNEEPMVHITGKRFTKRRGRTMEVKIYTNQASVRLDVNGKEWDEALVKDRTARFAQIPLRRRGGTMLRARAMGITGREECSDTALFIRVRKSEPSYACPENDPFHFLKNWFEGEPDEAVPPLVFPVGCLSIRDKIRHILRYPEGEAIVRKYAGPLYDHPMFPMAKGFSPEKLARLRPGTVPESFLFRINEELIRIRK